MPGRNHRFLRRDRHHRTQRRSSSSADRTGYASTARRDRIALISAGERTLLGGVRGRGPFRLHLPLPDFEAHMVEAHQTRPAVEASGDTVVLRYAHLLGKRGPVDVGAQVTIWSAQDGGFELSCRIHNGTQIKIPQVFFPWISGFAKIDGDADQ